MRSPAVTSAPPAMLALAVQACTSAAFMYSSVFSFFPSRVRHPTNIVTSLSANHINIAPSQAAITAEDVPSVPIPPWYSDSSLSRDRTHVAPTDRGFDYRPGANGDYVLCQTMLDVLSKPTSRIVPFQGENVYVRQIEKGPLGSVQPLFLRFEECDNSWFCDTEGTISWLGQRESDPDGTSCQSIDVEDGEGESLDYFAIDIPSKIDLSYVLNSDDTQFSTVRNFGDMMPSRTHAALLATANGILTFHRTHRYCSKCGSPTAQVKAGMARKCTGSTCKTSFYPRIDPAVIMLITSPCHKYALLGRKKTWPSGRYSTLAGFLEVGETLEECVVRETFEESGVVPDPKSIRFSATQPWPFPRSMMIGFHGTALPNHLDEDRLPKLDVDPTELEDCKWFDKAFVRENGLVEGRGSSALDHAPNEDEAEFHVPGPASLARLLITEWVTGDDF